LQEARTTKKGYSRNRNKAPPPLPDDADYVTKIFLTYFIGIIIIGKSK
jgi:hypothetical protein